TQKIQRKKSNVKCQKVEIDLKNQYILNSQTILSFIQP
ncbi:MAG: hypothetical protein ACI90V_002752, partial [Bacillariaceae sp.]